MEVVIELGLEAGFAVGEVVDPFALEGFVVAHFF